MPGASQRCESVRHAAFPPDRRPGADPSWPPPPHGAGDSTEPLANYPHKSFVAKSFGTGARSYWIFEPAEPTPEKAPVVVFHHGWLAINPGVYGAWIEHLAQSGRIVIFPKYQTDFSTRPAEFLPNAVAAVRDALDVLETAPGHVRPDRDRFAIVGHSAGGNLSVADGGRRRGDGPARAQGRRRHVPRRGQAPGRAAALEDPRRHPAGDRRRRAKTASSATAAPARSTPRPP